VVSVYDLKPRFQQLLQIPTDALHARGVTANQVTLAAALASLLVGGALAWILSAHDGDAAGPGLFWLILPLFLFLRMAANAIDGMLARQFAMQSPLGAILNEAGDVVSDAALYLPFALLADGGGWVVVLVLLAAVSELVGVLGVTIGATRRYDGPMGKSDRAFVFGLLGLLFGVGVPSGTWFTLAMLAVIALLLLTIYNRGRRALAQAGAAS
jgi:CDP-diacylglycerol--glycerol-3-phosphate 3-phosphatidyltransferase